MGKIVTSVFIIVFFCNFSFAAIQDSLNLETAILLAKKNYPITKQKDLLDKTASLTFKNISTALLPQLNVVAQASYQSAVTQIPVSFPGFTIIPLSKDQYKFIIDLNQLLYDGGQTKAQKNIIVHQNKIDQQKIEAEYERLQQKINDLWFAILLMQEQEHLLDLIQNDLLNLIDRMQQQVENGTSFKSSLYNLQAEKIHNDQRKTDIRYNKKALIEVLSLFINKSFNESTLFIEPDVEKRGDMISDKKPDRLLFSYQRELTDAQLKLLNTKVTPRLSLFAQGGYGKPGINLLKNEFDLYYIGGIRLNWNMGALYTYGREKEIYKTQKQMLQVQEEQFLLMSNADLKRQNADISRLMSLMDSDEQIIDLKQKVMLSSKAQLENGVITSGDYIREQNAEEQAKLSKSLHRLQLKQTILNHNISTAE